MAIIEEVIKSRKEDIAFFLSNYGHIHLKLDISTMFFMILGDDFTILVTPSVDKRTEYLII